MHLLKYFDKLSLKPDNANELKGLILDLAIRGRLTEEWRKENSIEKSAIELLEEIQEEKTRLLNEKKIKKEKPLKSISSGEHPYTLPSNWAFSRLGNIIRISSGNGLTKKDMVNSGGIPVFGGNGINGYHNQSNVNKPSLVIGRVGFYCGSVHITPEKAWVTDNAFISRFSENHFDILFLELLLNGTNLKENENATAQPVISGKKIYPIVLGIPPLEEQKAIVQIVNQLMDEVDQLETQTKTRVQFRQDFIQSSLRQLTRANSAEEWKKLQPHFTTFFDTIESIDKLKEAILQLAVQGKLTKQWRKENPNVEPASVLLERIKDEKARLIKEKKIKKEKTLPEISEDEIPFELPKGWKWCRMWELCPNISSGSTPPKTYFVEKGIPYLKVYNIRNQKIDFDYKPQYVDQEYHSTKLKRSILNPGDVIYNIVGPPLGKTAIIPNDFTEWNCNQAIAFFKPIIKEMNIWIYTYLLSKVYLKDIELIGTAGQDNISVTKSKMIKIPLPPIEEQNVIVDTVNQLIKQCENVKSGIDAKESLSKKFLKSSIREVMEQTMNIEVA